MKYLILFVFFVVVLSNEESRSIFNKWKTTHNKVYASAEEEERRFQIFQTSIARARALQKRADSRAANTQYGPTPFSDMTPEEFKQKLMTPFKPTPNAIKQMNQFPSVPTSYPQAVPTSYDWRHYNVVTPVKDQGQCGSCWAFSVTENIESVWMLKKNINFTTMPPLSPQQIVDCDKSDDGCGGGDTPTAYEYVIGAGGLDAVSEYPYTAEDGACAFKKSAVVATISNWHYATTDENEETMKQNLVKIAPLSICLDAANWQDYAGGVMTAWECAWINTLDHCVQLVGYDVTVNPPYWIVRNSWGSSWGESGYIRLEYGENTCGLAEEVTSAVV